MKANEEWFETEQKAVAALEGEAAGLAKKAEEDLRSLFVEGVTPSGTIDPSFKDEELTGIRWAYTVEIMARVQVAEKVAADRKRAMLDVLFGPATKKRTRKAKTEEPKPEKAGPKKGRAKGLPRKAADTAAPSSGAAQ